MLIRCPQCGTGFNLPESKIPPAGAKVKCSACVHTFRVRIEHGEPVFFYKKGEAPRSGETMIGTPVDLNALANTVAAYDESSEKTKFGIPQRSKSAKEGYNPFPLAGAITSEQPSITAEQAHNDRTQLFGSLSEANDDDDRDLRDDDRNERTQLGPGGLAEESLGDRTKIGSPSRQSGPPPLRTTEDDLAADDRGNETQAIGSGGLDLFDGALPERPSSPPPIDIDPFGDAFDEPVGDVGLLMPSTPMVDEPSNGHGLSLDSSSEVSGMSEEQFLLGGGRSDFGDALSLVDNDFGDDRPSFDPHSGNIEFEPQPRRAGIERHDAEPEPSIELGDRHPTERAPSRSTPRRSEAEPPATRSAERKRPAARPAPAYVHEVGASSPLRRTFDLLFIGLIVGVGFVGLIAAQAGGFVDFTRFGHMVEVAFAGVDFQPRDEWTRVVEISPPEAPPDEPLRLQNVHAVEKQLGDQRVLVVAGRIRNYSLEVFKGVKVKAEVKDGDKVVVKRVHTVGQTINRKKFANAKSVDGIKESLVTKLPDIGKEGTTYFAIVFDDVPKGLVEGGNYDYAVTVAD